MVEIIPAIMPKNYDDLVGKVGLFAGVVPLVQIDIMDGKFVPNRTWPYNPGDKHFEKISREEEGMPEWETIYFEADLMVQNPEEVVGQWVMAGAQRIIVHSEGLRTRSQITPPSRSHIPAISHFSSIKNHSPYPDTAHNFLNQKNEILQKSEVESEEVICGRALNNFDKIRDIVPKGIIELGIALNPSTPLSSIEPYLDRVDFVQCMGIAQIGFQGEPFDERVLKQIRSLRALRPDMPISVDGAVNFETAEILVKAGATRLVSGSAILRSGDISHAILGLRDIVSG